MMLFKIAMCGRRRLTVRTVLASSIINFAELPRSLVALICHLTLQAAVGEFLKLGTLEVHF